MNSKAKHMTALSCRFAFFTFLILANFVPTTTWGNNNGISNTLPGKERIGMTQKNSSGNASNDRIKVELWTMSQCPFAIHAVSSMNMVNQFLAPHIDLRTGFILREKKEKSGFTSLHGDPEVELDMVFACADKIYHERIIDFMAETYNSNNNWEEAGAKLGLDIRDIRGCMENGTGYEQLSRNGLESKSRKINASPSVFINGKKYKARVTASNLFQEICKGIDSEHRPDICRSVPQELSTLASPEHSGTCGESDSKTTETAPEELKITHTIIYDPGALALDFNKLIKKALQIYPSGRIEILNAASKQGIAQLTGHGITLLPALVVSKEIEKTANFKALKKVIIKSPSGTHYITTSAFSGSNRDITRPIASGLVQVFYNPVDKRALTLLLELNKILRMKKYQYFEKNIKITPFIPIDKKGNFITQEASSIEELLRQHAVLKYWPDKFFTYINFIRKDIQSLNWEESAARAGLNKSDMINRKILESVKRLAEAEIHNIMETGIKSKIAIQIFIENRELIIPHRKEDFIKIFHHLRYNDKMNSPGF